MSYVDLHAHSDTSDGTLSPEQAVHLAHEAGLSAIALTDHDTTAGVDVAMEAGTRLGLGMVPGIEMSSSFKDHEIHIFGLFMDADSPSLQATLKKFRQYRNQRNQEILKHFDAHDIHLTAEELCVGNPGTVITRAHVARALLAKGLGPDLDHIFREYLKCGGTYCPPEEFLPPEAVMEALLNNHAFVALARPFQYKLGDRGTQKLITCLAGLGIEDLKVYHSSRSRLEIAKLQEMTTRHHLLPTGGSDFHGNNKPGISIGTGWGGLRVSSLLLNAIKNALQSLFFYENSQLPFPLRSTITMYVKRLTSLLHFEKKLTNTGGYAMKIQNVTDVEEFFSVIDQCKGTMELVSPGSDRINLKSKLTQYPSVTTIFSSGYIKGLDLVAHEKEDIRCLTKYIYQGE